MPNTDPKDKAATLIAALLVLLADADAFGFTLPAIHIDAAITALSGIGGVARISTKG
jgi:hypothetical protein